MCPAKPAQDGRIQRSTRSRERLIDALIGLVEEGHLLPTGQEVADRAEMNLRTVFRHFEDMESLYAAIHEKLERKLRPLLHEDPPEGVLSYRLSDFVRRRTRAYERIAPFQRSERLTRWTSPQLERVHAEFVSRLRADLIENLPEVAELPNATRGAAELVSSFESWDRLRTEQGLGPRQTVAVIEDTLTLLLRGFPGKR